MSDDKGAVTDLMRPRLKRYEVQPEPPGPASHESFEAIVERVLGETITTPDGEAAIRRELLARVFIDEAMIKRNPAMMKLLVERIWQGGAGW